jgi:hypothetical protein
MLNDAMGLERWVVIIAAILLLALAEMIWR